MPLTCEMLFKYSLLENMELRLFEKGNQSQLLEFFDITQRINSVDQFIIESPSFPGSTDKIKRGELVSGIGATLAIEGTTIGEEEIEESFRKADLNEQLKRKEQEAENSRKVYHFILDLQSQYGDEFIYSEAMIKQIHKYFSENMDYLSNTPGDYRGDFDVTFGSPRKKSLCRSRADVINAMGNFVSWLNQKEESIVSGNTIVKAIMAHYYLTEIHPFGDGNGRTARALEALVLYINGINDYCFWSLSNFWSTHKDKYLIHLDSIRRTCDPTDFVIWGMKGYLEEIESIKKKVLTKVKRLMLMDYVKYLLEYKSTQKTKINKRIVDVIRLLIRAGKVEYVKFRNYPEVKALFQNVSNATISRDFKKMIEKELITITKVDEILYVEANYKILDHVRYNV